MCKIDVEERKLKTGAVWGKLKQSNINIDKILINKSNIHQNIQK